MLKIQVTLLLSIFVATTLTWAHKVEVKNILELVEDDDEDEDEVGTLDLEKEIFRSEEERHLGLHIINKNGEVVLEEPTHRVLRAIMPNHNGKSTITLEEAKAMYKRLQGERRKQPDRNQERVKEILKREQEHYQVDETEDSFIKRVLSLVW